MEELIHKNAYYVEAPEQVIVNPVAIRPTVYPDLICWEDTSKGRSLRYREVITSSAPDTIQIITEEGFTVWLYKLTKQLYDEKVKSQVMLPPEFDSDEAVQRFYLESHFL